VIDLWFDVVCPFAWLAARQLPAIAARAGVPLVWRPMLLGGVLKGLGVADPNDVMPPAKVLATRRDALRQAELQGLTIAFPTGHPRRSVEAMRLLVAAPADEVPDLAHEMWHRYWVEGRDFTDRRVDDPAVKEGLRRNTDAAIAAGVFGAPGIGVNGRIHWGADRLWRVERDLGLAPTVDPLGRSVPARHTGAEIAFWHDFSSPFAYLAAAGIEALADRFGATVRWRPILLGGLFRAIGTPDVPLATYSAPRRQWTLRDLDDWARERGVPFRFPRAFPLRTILPLRVALRDPRATHPLYRAAWADDRDIGDPLVVRAVLAEAGLDPGLVDAAPQAREALRANTEQAAAAGVIGVPTMQVGDQLVWGQDRFDHLARILAGWRPREVA
jgi:2-hydroxychromene-2-carboxylate isomerase